MKTCRLHWKKTAETKIPKTKRNPQESSSKTIIPEEKIDGDPKETKMATRFSSRLKSVPEKLKNSFTEQDEEYFSSQETDEDFFSEKFGKKQWN